MREWLARIRDWLQRDRLDAELAEELRFHREQLERDARAAGADPEEAVWAARRRLGNATRVHEEARGRWSLPALDGLAQDARFALRHFRRTPLATVAMAAVLALGIGANTALYTLVRSVATLPPPGVARDEALVRIRGIERSPQLGVTPRAMPPSEVEEYARQRELFSAVGAWSSSSAVLDLGDAETGVLSASATYVTDSYFQLLGVRPVLGAGLPATAGGGDASSALVAMISHTLWERYFGRSLDVVGRTVKVNGVAVTLLGVAPPRFGGLNGSSSEPLALWLPLAAEPLLNSGPSDLRADSAVLRVFARLRPGVTAEEATPTVRAIGARAAPRTWNGVPGEVSADVAPLLADNLQPGSDSRWVSLALLFGTVTLLILLVTCTNVSGLLVGVAIARRREIAVRLSLGASRGRLVRQLLTESVLLAAAAGVLAMAMLAALVAIVDARLPELQLTLDWTVLAFTAVFAVATGILFGLSPALHATRLAVGEVLKDASAAVSGSRSWLQRGIVVAQIAVTQPLLVGLGAVVLLVGSELSARPSREVHVRIASLSFGVFSGIRSLSQAREQMDRLTERLRDAPGVLASVVDDGSYTPAEVVVAREHRVPGVRYPERLQVREEWAARGYFGLMEIPLVRGRDFTEDEVRPIELPTAPGRFRVARPREDTPVIIGEDLARDLWGPADPLGRRLEYAGDAPGDPGMVVVGVVDQSAGWTTESGDPLLFLPRRGMSTTVLVRTAGPAEAMLPALRAVASAEAPGVPITAATTLAAVEAGHRRSILRMSGAAAAGGLLALLLSAVGLYALVALSVGQRTREIGIRMAMGARASQVVRTFFLSGIKLTALGLVIGLPLSMLALRILALQVGISDTRNPLLAAVIAGTVIAVAAVATWMPARRAAAVDPLISLRGE